MMESENIVELAAQGMSCEDCALHVEEQGQSLTPGTGGGDSPDLMVIGAGSAGFAAAIRAAELGFSVTVVEAGTIGDTCVNVGCVPSKTLIRSVEQVHRAGSSPFRGASTRAERLDWKEVITQKDELVARLRDTRGMVKLVADRDTDRLLGAHIVAPLAGEMI